jgi:hypothetical protein
VKRAGRSLLIAALAALGGALAPPAQAGIWTQIPSGTTQDIAALDYQGGDRFWLATANGNILYRQAGAFHTATGTGLPTSITFNDIAFQPGTNVGLAVGNSNNIWRSTDGGHTWGKLTETTVTQNCFSPSGSPPVAPIGDMFTIAWGPNNVVYLGGDNNTMLRSANAGASFDEVNKVPGACQFNAEGVSDIFFFPSATSRSDEKLYIQARQAFGKIFFSADGLLSAAVPRDESINGTEDNTNLAVDPTNTNRLWATNQCGFTCLYRSEDGAANFDCVCTIRNEGNENQIAWYDVEYAGGTIVAAGRGGQIVNSVNGVDFFYNKADGALNTKDWRAVGLASAADAAVGGTGGALIVTSAANTTPDIIPPTGTISGPTNATAGVPASYTLNAADEGGSGLNPGSFSWTSAGLPSQSGQTVQFTFPSSGFFTIRVAFADNAGNTGEATLSVNVGSGPTITPVLSLRGPGNTATAVIVGSRIKVRMKGSITMPPGIDKNAACTGQIRLKLKKGKRTMLNRTTPVKLKKGKCRFAKTVYLKRSKVGKTRRLKLKIRFLGNQVLKAGSVSKTLTIRK